MKYIHTTDSSVKDSLLRQGYQLISVPQLNKTINNEPVWIFENHDGLCFDINGEFKNKCFITDSLRLTF